MKSPLTKLKIISSFFILGQVIFHHQPVQAGTFTNLYVFGDNFVDDGNYYELTGQPGEPYAEGRFSNGKLFVELLGDRLGFTYNSAHNYAVAGATTDSHPLNDTGVITERNLGFAGQVDRFIGESETVDAQALYAISAGGNDYLSHHFDLNGDSEIDGKDTEGVVTNITTSIRKLVDAGAKNFLVVDLLDYTKSPLLSTSSEYTEQQKEQISSLIGEQNRTLHNSLNELTDIKFSFIDLNKVFEDNIDKFKNTTDSCLTKDLACDAPEKYVYWDNMHPTASANEILADEVVNILKASDGRTTDLITTGVPEPLTFLGVGTAIGFGLFFKRKQANPPPTDDGGMAP